MQPSPPPPLPLPPPTMMEEAEEKMAALKRAYADIILNTAKESAARILEAERKALRSQQNLFLAKEEALSTLLRLKSIMESKINEAERASLGHVRRIQELEIQLTEAESTIKYLKVELQRANDELEDMRSKQTEPLDKESTKGHATIHEGACQQNKLLSTSVLCPPISGTEKMPPFDHKKIALMQRAVDGRCVSLFENATRAGPLRDLCADHNCGSSSDLASIIMRSKEPELYRNGCTQRIRALEQNILTGNVPLGETDDQFSKNESVVCKNEIAGKPCVEDSLQTDDTVIQAKNLNGLKEIIQNGELCESGQVKCLHRYSFRKKRTRCKRKRHIVHSTSKQDKTDHEPSQVYSSMISGNDKMMKPSGIMLMAENGTSQIDLDSHSTPGFDESSRISEDRIKHLDLSVKSEELGLLNCKNAAHSHSVIEDGIDGYLNSDHHISGTTLLNMGNIEHESIIRATKSSSKSDVNDGVLMVGHAENNGSNNFPPKEELQSDQKEKENSDASTCKVNLGTEDVLSMNSDPKIERTGPAANDKLLKYTFRRKRKRGSGIINENVLPEKRNTVKRRTEDKQSALPEPQKPISAIESSRVSRRLVQVARQLISLSGKKW